MDKQVPAAVEAEINQFVEEKTKAETDRWKSPSNDPDRIGAFVSGFAYGIRAGATEYATKLLQEQQENESLTNQLKHHSKVSDENMKLLRQEYEALQAKCERLEGVLMEIENDWFAHHLQKPKDNPIAIRCREALSAGEGKKETPEWIEWLCDRSPDVPDLSDSTEEEKKLLVDTLFQSAGIQFMKMFYAVGLEKFMESGLVNDSTGDLFRLRFELMQKGHKENQKEDQ